jgi:hypothetical protein
MATDTWSTDGFVKMNLTPNSGSVNCHSIDQAITPAGTNAAGATPLVSSINILGVVASGGVALPSVNAAGALVDVLNGGTAAITIYPPTGGIVNGGTINQAFGTIAAASAGVAGKATFVNLGGSPPGYLSK